MEASFNDNLTLNVLEKLLPHQQLAVGLACCERMLPNYAKFMAESGWGDIAPLRNAINAAWDACIESTLTIKDADQALALCELSIPDGEDFTSIYTSAAQDAAISVCTVIDYLCNRGSKEIVRVLRYSTESVDLIVQEMEKMDPRDSNRELRILQHPLMQQELARQRRDLNEAEQIGVRDGERLLAFRRRSEKEHNLSIAGK